MNKHKWYAHKIGNTFYAVRATGSGRNRRNIWMHREIIHPPDHLIVDHINHNGLDNRKASLRPATRAQNNYNRLIVKRKDSSSKYKGVAWKKENKKWQAQINFKGDHIFLGYFKDERKAAKAYDEAAKKYYGEFACLNIPE